MLRLQGNWEKLDKKTALKISCWSFLQVISKNDHQSYEESLQTFKRERQLQTAREWKIIFFSCAKRWVRCSFSENLLFSFLFLTMIKIFILGRLWWMFFRRWIISVGSQRSQHDAPQRRSDGNPWLERKWQESFVGCDLEESWWSRQGNSVVEWSATDEESFPATLCLRDSSNRLHPWLDCFTDTSLHAHDLERLFEEFKSPSDTRRPGFVTSVQQESRKPQHQRTSEIGHWNPISSRPGDVVAWWTDPSARSTRCVLVDINLVEHCQEDRLRNSAEFGETKIWRLSLLGPVNKFQLTLKSR